MPEALQGVTINGVTYKFDYEYLENKPEIPNFTLDESTIVTNEQISNFVSREDIPDFILDVNKKIPSSILDRNGLVTTEMLGGYDFVSKRDISTATIEEFDSSSSSFVIIDGSDNFHLISVPEVYDFINSSDS